MNTRLRCLILAEDCNPNCPSAPAMAYQAIMAMAEYADLTVVTHIRNQADIEAERSDTVKFLFIDNEYIARPMYKLGEFLIGNNRPNISGHENKWRLGGPLATAVKYPGYLAFEWEVWKRLKEALNRKQFDLVHRITPVSPVIPSPMAKWSPVPFILGPVNGGISWPPGFETECKREKERLVQVLNLRSLAKIFPYQKKTYQESAAVLCGFPHTLKSVPEEAIPRSIIFPEIGFDPNLFGPEKIQHSSFPNQLTFLTVGRLVPIKCVDLIVEAFVQSPILKKHRLHIVGDGPDRTCLENMVSKAGLQHIVTFFGWRSQAKVSELMQQVDVFVFPSIREFGGGVVVEAMASGLCCIVADYGGPGQLIKPDRGLKIAITNRDEMLRDLIRALEKLASSPETIHKYGEAASCYSYQEYSWDAKAKKMLQVYDWVLGKTTTKPTLFEN